MKPIAVRFRLIILLSLFAALPTARAQKPDAPRPNIVILLADDLGSQDVGWHGSEIHTPNLDALAKGGARLEQFYVQPLCSPTRAALLTGRYPFRYGLQVGVIRPFSQYGLPLAERTLPQALKEAGYETAIDGKWHLGSFDPAYLPTRRGFDHQYGLYEGLIDYFTHLNNGALDWHRDDHESHDVGYSTHLIANEAVQRIEQRDKSKPLFLYVAFNGVHSPYEAPQEYVAPYTQFTAKRKIYAGMTTAVDEAAGQILDELRRQDILKNTVIFFASDNGGPAPGRITSNLPFRAGKGSVYEGGVRSPGLVYWEGHVKPGTVVNVPLHVVDWYPTLLTLAGASTKQDLPLDGQDAWAAITAGAPSPHSEIVLNSAPHSGAIRVGDYKLVYNPQRSGDFEDRSDDQPGINDAAPASAERIELYNLADDPSEKHDLAAEKPDILHDLRTRYDAIAHSAAPPLLDNRPAGFKVPRVWGQKD